MGATARRRTIPTPVRTILVRGVGVSVYPSPVDAADAHMFASMELRCSKTDEYGRTAAARSFIDRASVDECSGNLDKAASDLVAELLRFMGYDDEEKSR